MEAQALHLLKAEGKEERTGYMAVASGKGGVGKNTHNHKHRKNTKQKRQKGAYSRWRLGA